MELSLHLRQFCLNRRQRGVPAWPPLRRSSISAGTLQLATLLANAPHQIGPPSPTAPSGSLAGSVDRRAH